MILAGIESPALGRNSERSYRSVLRYFCAWHPLRFGHFPTFPTPPRALKLYLMDHFGWPDRASAQPLSRILLRVTMPKAVNETLIAHGYKRESGRQKMSTIRHHFQVLAILHPRLGVPSPLLDPHVDQLIWECRRAARLIADVPRRRPALPRTQFDAMLATCGSNYFFGVRDRALLYFAWASGGRAAVPAH